MSAVRNAGIAKPYGRQEQRVWVSCFPREYALKVRAYEWENASAGDGAAADGF
jgi:hypothetical protein